MYTIGEAICLKIIYTNTIFLKILSAVKINKWTEKAVKNIWFSAPGTAIGKNIKFILS